MFLWLSGFFGAVRIRVRCGPTLTLGFLKFRLSEPSRTNPHRNRQAPGTLLSIPLSNNSQAASFLQPDYSYIYSTQQSAEKATECIARSREEDTSHHTIVERRKRFDFATTLLSIKYYLYLFCGIRDWH